MNLKNNRTKLWPTEIIQFYWNLEKAINRQCGIKNQQSTSTALFNDHLDFVDIDAADLVADVYAFDDVSENGRILVLIGTIA